ncbi:MAG TPA: phosphopantetheine-binding protein [Allosphingosinicella sp.]|jgi:acyl carrier protein
MSRDEVRRKVGEFMSRAMGGRRVGADDDIFAMGFANSMFAMQLVQFVESQFDVTIESEDLELENFSTVERVTALVERKLAAPA